MLKLAAEFFSSIVATPGQPLGTHAKGHLSGGNMAAVVQLDQKAMDHCQENRCRRRMMISFVAIVGAGLLLFAVDYFFTLPEKVTWERIVYCAVSLCLVMATYFQGFRMPLAVAVDQAAKQTGAQAADENQVEIAT